MRCAGGGRPRFGRRVPPRLAPSPRRPRSQFGCVAAYLRRGRGVVRRLSRRRGTMPTSPSRRGRRPNWPASAPAKSHPHSVLVLLCDGLTPDQREMARGAYEVTSAVVPLVGGAAGDDLHWQRTYTFGEGRVLTNGFVAVWINSPRPDGRRRRPRLAAVRKADARDPSRGRRHPRARRAARAGRLPLRARRRAQGGRPVVRREVHGAADRPPQHLGRYDLRQIHETRPGGGLVLTTGVPEQRSFR